MHGCDVQNTQERICTAKQEHTSGFGGLVFLVDILLLSELLTEVPAQAATADTCFSRKVKQIDNLN